MALIDPNKPQRLDIPNEPNEWVEILPMTAGDLIEVRRADVDQEETVLLILSRCLKAWSYDAPITTETLKQLDTDTFDWLSKNLTITSAMRSEEERRNLDLPSSRPTGQETADSQKNLAISGRSAR